MIHRRPRSREARLRVVVFRTNHQAFVITSGGTRMMKHLLHLVLKRDAFNWCKPPIFKLTTHNNGSYGQFGQKGVTAARLVSLVVKPFLHWLPYALTISTCRKLCKWDVQDRQECLFSESD